jgi:hypothetical protein
MFTNIFIFLPLFFSTSICACEIEMNECKKITEISPQGDWYGWLLGYIITLNDGTRWFTERGPIDYWDWEIGNEIRIESLDSKEKRKLLSPAMGIKADYRLINSSRDDYDDFQPCALGTVKK